MINVGGADLPCNPAACKPPFRSRRDLRERLASQAQKVKCILHVVSFGILGTGLSISAILNDSISCFLFPKTINLWRPNERAQHMPWHCVTFTVDGVNCVTLKKREGASQGERYGNF